MLDRSPRGALGPARRSPSGPAQTLSRQLPVGASSPSTISISLVSSDGSEMVSVGGAIIVAGLADLWTGEPSYAEAIDGAPQDADTLVLTHSPDVLPDLPEGALVLAAHSHCGQVSIPLIGRPIVPIENKRYACGRVDEAGKIMYVTGGIGTSILPVRFLNPPEIVLITIRSAHERAAA